MMTQTIKEQILAVRDTGETNMFDVNAVQYIANREGYYELVVYLMDNRTISCLWKMPYLRLPERRSQATHFVRCMLGQILNAYSELPFLCMRHILRILRRR